MSRAIPLRPPYLSEYAPLRVSHPSMPAARRGTASLESGVSELVFRFAANEVDGVRVALDEARASDVVVLGVHTHYGRDAFGASVGACLVESW